ncbi:hypothetical protein FRB98_008757 [Tulasnella sp. 332]|nr:hypothetical protein FRB98_008757 [Tulasnella sp. 332]
MNLSLQSPPLPLEAPLKTGPQISSTGFEHTSDPPTTFMAFHHQMPPYPVRQPTPLGLERTSPLTDEAQEASNKRRKTSSDASRNNKQTRQLQSCDSCRERKVRCARPDPSEGASYMSPQFSEPPLSGFCKSPFSPGLSVAGYTGPMILGPNGMQIAECKPCMTMGLSCTYQYKAKKRGPPNQYMKRLRAAAAAAAALAPTGSHGPPSGSQHADGPQAPPQDQYSAIASGYLPAFTLSRANSPALADSRPNMTNDGRTSDNQLSPSKGMMDNTQPFASWSLPFHSDPRHSDAAGSHVHDLSPITPLRSSTDTSSEATKLADDSSVGHMYSLSQFASPSIILHILSLFFDYIYPLTPCIHRPTFYADLGEKREERDPIFFALVCSTLSSTLAQVPRSYLPMEKDEVRQLAQRLSDASRAVTVRGYDPPTSSLIVIRYFDSLYNLCVGQVVTGQAAYSEAVFIAEALGLHEEDSYEGLDFIEREVRRRAFWLVFGADKSSAVLLNRPICLRDEDCTVHFPTEVDDEYITARAILPQPPHKTAIISGFNYISRIFALLGEIVVRIRVDKRSPPRGAFAAARLEEVCALHNRVLDIFAQAPQELRLRKSGNSPRADGTSALSLNGVPSSGPSFDPAGFARNALAELHNLFDNPNANREDASNAYLVMQANIHVTQQVVRLVIEQYRHTLVTSMLASGVDPASLHSSIAANELSRGGWTFEDREAIARDLLDILRKIPILSIATNGPVLVHKVRFVASTLLDFVRDAETAPDPAAKALNILWDFLSMLSEIERKYLPLDNSSDQDQ